MACYFELLPEELNYIIAYNLIGTEDIYKFLEVLGYPDDIYFYKICRGLSEFFNGIPMKCSIYSRPIKWINVYENLMYISPSNNFKISEYDILCKMSDYRYYDRIFELYMIMLYSFKDKPTPFKSLTVYLNTKRIEPRSLMFLNSGITSYILEWRENYINELVRISQKYGEQSGCYIDADNIIFIYDRSNPNSTIRAVEILDDNNLSRDVSCHGPRPEEDIKICNLKGYSR